jgi:hypothetical protein
MSCIYYGAEGGTQQWFIDRAGAATASRFTECRKVSGGLNDQQLLYANAIKKGKSEAEAKEMSGYKAAPKAESIFAYIRGEKVGDFSQAAKDYAFKLAVERISGMPLDDVEFSPWQAKRGQILEADARLAYEERNGVLVEEVGFASTEDGEFGASVDGLVNQDGSTEIKCFLSPPKLKSILIDNDIKDCIDQVQGGMWITGRKWTDFILYCPALECIGKHLTVIRFERDEEYITELEKDMHQFNLYVKEIENQLRK